MSRALYLEGEFEGRGERRGGILLLDAKSACDMIAEATHRRVRVLGIDTFRLTETSTEPQYDHTLDLSAEDHLSRGDWDEAIRFVQERRDRGLHFEVVLADEIS